MKLELGPNQTLAYESAGGGWTLNNLPNFSDELARAQYYYHPPAERIVAGVVLDNLVYVQLTMTMRDTPTVIFNGNGLICTTAGNYNVGSIKHVIRKGNDTIQFCVAPEDGVTLPSVPFAILRRGQYGFDSNV